MNESGLVVLFGDNEAGKTSLCEFIKFVLFGSRKDKRKIYEPVFGGRYGGYVEVVSKDGCAYVIERYSKPQAKWVEDFKIRPLSCECNSEKFEKSFLDITRELYDELFGFSHLELSEISDMEMKDVVGRAISSGMGIKMENLELALKALRQSMDTVYKPSGTRPEANMILFKISTLSDKRLRLESMKKEGHKASEELLLVKEWLVRDEEARLSAQEDLRELDKQIEDLANSFSQEAKVFSDIALKNTKITRQRLFIGLTGGVCLLTAILSKQRVPLLILDKKIEVVFACLGALLLFIFVLIGFVIKKRKESSIDTCNLDRLAEAVIWAKNIEGKYFKDVSTFDLHTENEVHSDNFFEKKEMKHLKYLSARLKLYVADKEASIASLNRDIGGLSEKLMAFDDSQLQECLIELEASKENLRDMIMKWCEDSLTSNLISQAYENYSESMLPKISQHSSEFLKGTTDANYASLSLSLDSPKMLDLINDKGSTVDSTVVSKGTKDQIYLAIRLALIEAYCDANEPLPALMDDIFINFDKKRQLSTAKLLCKFFSKRSAFLFTCHEETLSCFKAIDNNLTIIRLEKGRATH